ncbi:MAG TPA: L,D-transpeptidase family protein [bacterium]|nr:L,D-transpeptidase family protein [bacterium]HPJ71547.1 L,D-transpeptidase family protein [bacterium]HPQ65795.1 L,D-transpeptidase family protein [bacterium]
MNKAVTILAGTAVAAAVLIWVLAFSSGNLEERRREGLSLFAAGRYAAAAELLETCRPDASVPVAEALALSWEKLGIEPARRLDIWRKLAADSPAEIRGEALVRLGAAAREAGDADEAERHFAEAVSAAPGSPAAAAAALALAELAAAAGENAIEAYRSVMDSFPGTPQAAAAAESVGALDLEALLRGKGAEEYRVRPGDSLAGLAAVFKTTPELLRRVNRLNGDMIREGQILRIPPGTFSVVASKSENRLTLLRDGDFFMSFPVGTGRDSSSPVGEFEIVTKLVDPVWYSRDGEIPPGDPRNILGSRWLGFGEPYATFGIHGTTQPETIGTQSSSGCIRMLNADVELLFDLLPRGTRVTIVE